MNFNPSGILNKLKGNAELVTFLASAYKRFNGDIGAILHNYTSQDFLQNLGFSIQDFNSIKYYLFESPHLYSTIFKTSFIVWIAGELGFLKQYQTLAKKAMWGSGIAALTLPGSKGTPTNAPSLFGNRSNTSSGNSPSWSYRT